MGSQMITRFLKDRRGTQDESLLSQSTVGASPASQSSQNSIIATPSPAPITPHRSFESPTTPTPHPRVQFSIKFDRLLHNGHSLKNPRLRAPSKQSLQRLDSFIWQHGAEIEDDNNSRIWLCIYCHQSKNYHEGTLIATSTNSSLLHLLKKHGIEDTSEKAVKKQELKEKGAFNSTGTCKTCGQKQEFFNAQYYKHKPTLTG